MTHMQHMVQKLQLLYVNKVVWENKPHATLIEEWHVLSEQVCWQNTDVIA